jgi:Restriction endonuclease S subunits
MKRKDTATKEITTIRDAVPRVALPRLRFPEFKGEGEWEKVILADITKRITKKVGDALLPTVSISAGKGFVLQSEKFGRDISGEQYKNYTIIEEGDFVYNKGNSKKYPEGCVYRLSEFSKVAAPNAFISFKLNEGFIPGILEQYFEANYHGPQLKRFITSGARSNGLLNIGSEHFFSIKIPLPSIQEQKKIAECLSSLDDLIAAHNRKLDALKMHKNGLLEQMFLAEGETIPRFRFPEFRNAGVWIEKKVEDLARRGSGHTPSKSEASYYNGGIQWVSLADSRKLDNGYIYSTDNNISELGIEYSSAVLHPAGSVILSRDAGVGKSAIMYSSMAVSQHFIVWICKEDQLVNWFYYYILQKMKSTFEIVASGSTIKTIGLSFFIDMKIKIPSLLEQQKIADCLSFLDSLIAAEAKKIEALKMHKKGLMQALFPDPDEANA